jgi:uncharacterized protein GlcG (DUF336 family)
MKSKIPSMLAGAAFILCSMTALGAGSELLPGDNGRPAEGIFNPNPPPKPAGATQNPPAIARAPAIDLAVRAAQAIAEGCKQFKLGITVVNSAGAPILVYIPDGSDAHHGYMALRKAYTAVTFKVPTSQLVSKAQQDAEFAGKIKSDPNLVAYAGGLPLKAGDDIIGAVGVSGAEPGHHDEECGLLGVERIKNDLK